MSDFKVIETQEQFDAAISARLQRDRESYAKKYEGWTSPEDLQKIRDDYDKKVQALQDAAASTEQKIAEKDAEIAKGAQYRTDLEKTRIALAAGLRIEYADRLRGETEEEWRADAAELAKDFAAAHVTAPLGSPQPTETGTKPTREKFAEWMDQNMNA